MEFLIAFIPVWILVLGICQLAFLATARVVVEHSAYRAARSAIVVLEDDPEIYGGIPRGYHLRQTGKHIEDISDVLAAMYVEEAPEDSESPTAVAGSVFSGSSSFVTRIADTLRRLSAGTGRTYSRMSKIRAAAYVPLIPLANAAPDRESYSIRGAIHSDFSDRVEAGIAMTRAVSAITLHSSPEASEPAPEPILRNSPITARVVYAYSCDVPVVRQLMCRSLAYLREHGDKDAVKALAHAEGYDEQSRFLRQSGRYALLVGKATLLNQGAGYQHEED